MTTKTRNWLIAVFIVVFPFVLFSVFFFSRLAEVPPTPPALPNPNGYDDLAKAGHLLADDTGDFNETNAAQLGKIVSANAAALALARAGLSNQCRVPIQYTAFFNSNHVSDLGWIKMLAQGFVAEGRLAEMENCPADAARSYLDTIHLANESVRGGLVIDALVGAAIEAIGRDHLQTLLPQLNARTCRKTAAALETLDSQRQTWNEVMQQENDWSHASFHEWQNDLARWETRKTTTAMYEKAGKRFDAQGQKTRQLIVDLAARAFELENGKKPATVSDLVPEYLKAVPQDPVNGKDLSLN